MEPEASLQERLAAISVRDREAELARMEQLATERKARYIDGLWCVVCSSFVVVTPRRFSL